MDLSWGQSNTKPILFRFNKDKRRMNKSFVNGVILCIPFGQIIARKFDMYI